MSFLDALFSGAKALAKELISVGRTLVHEILQEIDNSSFGKAATRVVSGVVDRIFGNAQDLAGEEADLAAKYQRDGRRTEADEERLRDIEAERDRLRAELEKANVERNAQEFRERAHELDTHVLDEDEISANVGILAAKACPQCGSTMRVIQGAFNLNKNERNFWWQCTAIKRHPCPNITIRPNQDRTNVVRPESADFDTPVQIRRITWESTPVLKETHERLRQHLGDEDKQLICPKHLLPLKLLQSRRPTGKLLNNYEYVCLSVNADGSACDHTVVLQTMPQVAAMLQRTEGAGIIRA